MLAKSVLAWFVLVASAASTFATPTPIHIDSNSADSGLALIRERDSMTSEVDLMPLVETEVVDFNSIPGLLDPVCAVVNILNTQLCVNLHVKNLLLGLVRFLTGNGGKTFYTVCRAKYSTEPKLNQCLDLFVEAGIKQSTGFDTGLIQYTLYTKCKAYPTEATINQCVINKTVAIIRAYGGAKFDLVAINNQCKAQTSSSFAVCVNAAILAALKNVKIP